mmetsp:Transcript_8796/g.22798  ORF Transcript_8796/g.22798 Transcript_8796/m.22798 type:complete len:493 (+) Transcript_8796:225-1703(+)
MAHAGTPASRLSRETKEPKRFAAQAQYATQRKPSVLRRAAESESDDDDSAQPGAMTGADFVKQEQKAAEAVGLSPQRAEAPLYKRDARAKKVTLPRGWKPSSPQEVEDYLKHLNSDQLNKIVRLHKYAFFSGGTLKTVGQATAKKWFLDHGLVVGPWHKPGFPGMCNSEALAKQRIVKVAQDNNAQSSHDATMARLAGMGLPKGEQTHDESYGNYKAEDLLTAAFLSGKPMPKGSREKQEKVAEWFPSKVGDCVDCGLRRLLVKIEHANGGPDDGKRRKPPCPEDNKGERAAFDVYADALYKMGEAATSTLYEDVIGVRLAYAQRPGASAEDKTLLAMGRRAAAEATVLEDREALRYASSLRGRRVCNDLGPTLEEARAAFEKKEEARMADERRKMREWEAKAAERAALPPVKVGTRVVIKETGARGVVQRTTGSGSWYHVQLGGETDTRGYRRGHLEIDTRKPAARKPAAKKRKAAEPARKPASKKKKSRK